MHDTIREVMTRNPLTMQATQTIGDAARAMRDDNIGDVIVMNDGVICGIVTDRDIVVRALAAEKKPYLDVTETPLSDVATKGLCTVSPDDPVDTAVQLMRTHAIRRIPVVEDGSPVGIVSLGDLALDRDPGSVLGKVSEAPPNN